VITKLEVLTNRPVIRVILKNLLGEKTREAAPREIRWRPEELAQELERLAQESKRIRERRGLDVIGRGKEN
jgi:hypothetical protein